MYNNIAHLMTKDTLEGICIMLKYILTSEQIYLVNQLGLNWTHVFAFVYKLLPWDRLIIAHIPAELSAKINTKWKWFMK
jgi:hypothetical protein